MRAAHPGARGLAREPLRPHHGRDATTAACGATRGASGGRRCAPPTSCASTPTARSSTARGTSRPPCSSTPSCTAPAPTPPSSCTTTRTTRRCSRRWASARRWCTRTRASSTASSRSSTSTAASRTRTTASGSRTQVGDASGILLAHHGAIVTAPTIAEACYKADDVRAHVPLHVRHARGRAHARRDSAPTRAPRSSRCCDRTRRRRTGTARCACCSRDEPEVLDVTGHVARRPREQRVLRRRQGPARDDHVAARARAARARVHRHLRRRPRGRAARRVHRPVPEEVRRRGTARRRRPTTAARRGCGRARCCRTSGSTRWSAGRRREYGFEPTRFDEMRRGAWDVHARVADMDIDGVCRVAVLPVVPARLRRPAAHDVARRRRARARRDARVQRLAPRRVVRRAARSLHPEPDRVPARSRRSRPTRSGATRRAASRP